VRIAWLAYPFRDAVVAPAAEGRRRHHPAVALVSWLVRADLQADDREVVPAAVAPCVDLIGHACLELQYSRTDHRSERSRQRHPRGVDPLGSLQRRAVA